MSADSVVHHIGPPLEQPWPGSGFALELQSSVEPDQMAGEQNTSGVSVGPGSAGPDPRTFYR